VEVVRMISADMQLQLARAVMRPGSRAMMIDEMNKRFGPLISIERAIRTAQNDSSYTYAIVVADEVIAIDSDQAAQWEAEDGTPGPLQEWLHEAYEWGLEPVVVESGGEGRHHAFVRVEDAETREHFVRLAEELGLERRHGGARIRPPGAPHRLRLPVDLDVTPEEALRRLRPSTPQHTTSRRRGWSTHVERLITHGAEGKWAHPDKRGADRSQLLWSAYWSAVQTGVDRDVLFARLRNPDGLHWEATRLICFRDGTVRDDRDARGEFDAEWARVEKKVRERPARGQHAPTTSARAKVTAEIERIRAVAHATIRGRTADTQLAVLDTFVTKGIRFGSLDVEYSQRALVEDCFCGTEATSAATLRLTGCAWLVVVSIGCGEEGSVYRLQIPPHLEKNCPLIETERRSGVSDPAASIEGHLLFSRRRVQNKKAKALGPAAGRLLAALRRAGKPVALREVVGDPRARLSRSMAYRGLAALLAWQLVIDEDSKLSVPADIEDRMARAVEEIGLDEAQAKRRERHLRERERYREELEEIGSGQRSSAAERQLMRNTALLDERDDTYVIGSWRTDATPTSTSVDTARLERLQELRAPIVALYARRAGRDVLDSDVIGALDAARLVPGGPADVIQVVDDLVEVGLLVAVDASGRVLRLGEGFGAG